MFGTGVTYMNHPVRTHKFGLNQFCNEHAKNVEKKTVIHTN